MGRLLAPVLAVLLLAAALLLLFGAEPGPGDRPAPERIEEGSPAPDVPDPPAPLPLPPATDSTYLAAVRDGEEVAVELR